MANLKSWLKMCNTEKETAKGTLFAIFAFFIWGLSPIYWKFLCSIPAFEVIMHRIIWSFIFLLPLLFLSKKVHTLWNVLTNLKLLLILLVTAAIVASNWFVFIWAVNHDMVLHASLGYYMNPIINVILAMIFLKERLRPFQKISVILATISVFYLTIQYGQFPWLAIYLAVSFGFYGLIHKIIPVNALEGLSVETMILSIPAGIYLLYIGQQGTGCFLQIDLETKFLLMGTALVTALPLLLFTASARRIHFSTIGFLQFIAPSCAFFLAVLIYKEPILKAQLLSFALIWIALVIYSTDSILYYRKKRTVSPVKRH